MTVQFNSHGGQCCGMAHIYKFKYPPETKIKKARHDFVGQSLTPPCGYGKSSPDYDANFPGGFWPQQTMEERFRAVVAQRKKHQTFGVTEVILATEKCYTDTSENDYTCETQYDLWHEIVESEGFKLVTTCKNSNSNRTIYIYHLICDEVGVAKAAVTPAAFQRD